MTFRLAGAAGLAVALLAVTACSGADVEGVGGTDPTTASSEQSRAAESADDASGIGGVPSEEDVVRARKDAEALATPRLAAQLVVPRRENDVAAAAALTQEVGFGGVVLFSEHVPSDPAALVSTVTGANERITRAVAHDRGWPAFVAVDQEGGPIQRLGAPLTQFPSAMALGASDDEGLAREVGSASGSELAALGFTVVLAPVADVTSGPGDPTIGVRSPGSDPARVSRIAQGYAQGYADAGLVSVAKHFPGHGSVSGDTHVGAVHQRADLHSLLRRDLLPFRDLAVAGAPAVMTAHVVLDEVDPQAPATLSQPVLTGVLRERLGFRGLIVTDALEMGAVTQGAGPGEAAVRALEAGADVLLMPTDPRAAVTAVTAAVESGRLSRERLLDSAALMIATLRHAAERADVAPVAPSPGAQTPTGPHADLALQVARSSITQLTGRCGERLVGDSITVSGGEERDRALLQEAARAAGLGVGGGTPVRLVGGGTYRAAEGDAPGEQTGTAGASSTDVTIALDVPYPLADSRGVTLAAFGRTPATFTALAEVLSGERAAPGVLPVEVGSRSVGAGCSS